MSALKKSPYLAPLRVFSALGDETRLRLVEKLCERSPQSISELTSDTEVTRQAITKHLRILEDAGLVKNIREGRESLFEFQAKPMAEVKKYIERVSEQWDTSLARFKTFVEES
jgi:DNA-binding transcriptional ArsR family regulator